MEPARPIFWNINNILPYYFLAVLSTASFLWGSYKRVKAWMHGQKAHRSGNLPVRLKPLGNYIFKNKGNLKGTQPRTAHLSIFYGFLLLAAGSAVAAAEQDLSLGSFMAQIYPGTKLVLDLSGLVVLIGLALAAHKRYIITPERLENTPEDALTLTLLLGIIITGFSVEGLRLLASGDRGTLWSPVGTSFSYIFYNLGVTKAQALLLHRGLWYVHLTFTFGFIAYIPYSKLFHIFTAPLNYYFRSLEPGGALSTADLPGENRSSYGAGAIREFTWKQLLDTDACIGCGRCHKNCPANLEGGDLSPKKLTAKLKERLREPGKAGKDKPLTGDVVTEQGLWSCTTCRICEDRCPMLLEHVSKIVDLRRKVVSTGTNLPPELKETFGNLELHGNPWGERADNRAAWTKGLDVPTGDEHVNPEVLYWVGCYGSFNPRNRQVSEAMIKILQKAGINYAVLGSGERCCGDIARRLGNELLYQKLACENIEILKGYGCKTILTTCPHCFNTLKNEYPQFDGKFHVVHHSGFILDLIKQGKIELLKTLISSVTYHDPCYLGRYNDIYKDPRKVLAAIPELRLTEMKHSHRKSQCCGAGGGRVWLDGNYGGRINEMRGEQALKTGCAALITACPLCLNSLSEGIRLTDGGNKPACFDLAELVEMSL